MRRFALGAALAVGLATVGGCGGDDEPDVATGTPLPDVTLPALDGGSSALALAALHGPAIVNLWATWCVPCRVELPAFATASAAHRDVRFVGVDIGEDPSEALAFLDELGVDTATFSQYADPDAALTDALEVSALPITILVGRDDAVADVHLGPLTLDDLTAALADL